MAGGLSRRRVPVTVAGLALGATVMLSAAAAVTTPFTPSAGAVVAVGFVPVVALAVVSRRRRAPSGPTPVSPPPSTEGPGSGEPHLRPGWRWGIWLLPLGCVSAWEVVAYAGSPRAAHPTLSSMLDAVDASHLGHGVSFAAWLILGCWLVTR